MKNFARNPWVLGIGTTVIGGMVLTFVLDWIKGVDWLSTFNGILKFTYNAIIAFLNFELKVWWALLVIVFGMGVLFVISKVLSAKTKNDALAFLSYTKDSVLGYTWEWGYVKGLDGKYTITNLHPVCSKCGMHLKQGGMYGWEMKCLRCNTVQQWQDDYLTDAHMLIDDNIRKKYLQNQQNQH